MSTAEQRRKAFAAADAIMTLEGFEKTAEMTAIQQAIIDGRVTFDQAVQAILEDAKARANNPDAKS